MLLNQCEPHGIVLFDNMKYPHAPSKSCVAMDHCTEAQIVAKLFENLYIHQKKYSYSHFSVLLTSQPKTWFSRNKTPIVLISCRGSQPFIVFQPKL